NPSLRGRLLGRLRLGHRHRDQHRGCDHSCWHKSNWGSHHACATSSEEQRGVQAWWVSEVRPACRTFQESRAVRQLCRASLASGRKGVLTDAHPNTWRAPFFGLLLYSSGCPIHPEPEPERNGSLSQLVSVSHNI